MQPGVYFRLIYRDKIESHTLESLSLSVLCSYAVVWMGFCLFSIPLVVEILIMVGSKIVKYCKGARDDLFTVKYNCVPVDTFQNLLF